MKYRILESNLTPGEIIVIEVYSSKQKEPIKIYFSIHDDNDQIALGATILLKDKLPLSHDLLEDEINLAEEVLDVLKHNTMVKAMLNLKGDPLNPTKLFGRCMKCGENAEISNPCCNSNILYNGSEIDPSKISFGFSMMQYPDGKID
jgi:DNA polymerase II large subunit